MGTFGQSIDPGLQCHLHDDYESHRWSFDSSMVHTGSRSPSITGCSAMNRFLHEPDGPYFPAVPPFPQGIHLAILHRESTHLEGYVMPGSVRYPSPAYTSTASTSWSDPRETSPFASKESTAAACSPVHVFDDDGMLLTEHHPAAERRDSHSGGCCVAMHDVQKTADELPDTSAYDNGPASYIAYGSYAQEGYEPLSVGESNSFSTHSSTPSDHQPQPSSYSHEEASPVIRRRRPQSSRCGSSPASSAKISKRPQAGRRSSSYQHSTDATEDTDSSPSAVGSFPCPLAIYGCTSSFKSKNEWKRHVSSQHLRLGYWRCDLCGNERNKKHNDFNRKDLFTQHVRRMHAAGSSQSSPDKKSSNAIKDEPEEHILSQAATRCYRALRTSPEKSWCPFCEQKFRGPGSWDDRMEHVGRHMETAKKDGKGPVNPHEWPIDEPFQQWLVENKILVVQDRHWVLEG